MPETSRFLKHNSLFQSLDRRCISPLTLHVLAKNKSGQSETIITLHASTIVFRQLLHSKYTFISGKTHDNTQKSRLTKTENETIYGHKCVSAYKCSIFCLLLCSCCDLEACNMVTAKLALTGWSLNTWAPQLPQNSYTPSCPNPEQKSTNNGSPVM